MRYTLPSLDGTKESDVARLEAWERSWQRAALDAEMQDLCDHASTLHGLAYDRPDKVTRFDADHTMAEVRLTAQVIDNQLDLLLDGAA